MRNCIYAIATTFYRVKFKLIIASFHLLNFPCIKISHYIINICTYFYIEITIFFKFKIRKYISKENDFYRKYVNYDECSYLFCIDILYGITKH